MHFSPLMFHSQNKFNYQLSPKTILAGQKVSSDKSRPIKQGSNLKENDPFNLSQTNNLHTINRNHYGLLQPSTRYTPTQGVHHCRYRTTFLEAHIITHKHKINQNAIQA